jgi:MFS family permease
LPLATALGPERPGRRGRAPTWPPPDTALTIGRVFAGSAARALPLRGVLYTLVRDPVALVAIQILDGVGAGIFGALFPIVVADVTEGSGRYNLAQGASATAWGLGAALSNGVAGYVVDWAGYNAAFLFLAGCAAVALLALSLMVPETRGWTQRTAGHNAAAAAQPGIG